MRRTLPALMAVLVVLVATATAQAATTGARQYVVLYEAGAGTAAAQDAIARAGGKVVSENKDIGLATVQSDNASFVTDVSSSAAVAGAARDRAIGEAIRGQKKDAAEDDAVVLRSTSTGPGDVVQPGAGPDPLSQNQWDMRAIGAQPGGSYDAAGGQGQGVRVGVIDTGIDGNHPDIAPNFNASLSRNFTVDDPVIDGPCDQDIDGSCASDPPNVDEDGHGTHVASTIASPINGQGIAGVAPKAELVNLRAGQDSGYFFLQPTVDALTYAGNNGIDVVNMSFYIDPWLFNCTNLREDSQASQIEQRTIIAATQKALDYAWSHGVTLISALGNEHTDLGRPKLDQTSPDYPGGTEYTRHVNNDCLNLPAEGNHVISVSSVGPSGRKAYYSNYGTEQTDVSAPGGDRRDFFGTPMYGAPETRILAAYPKNVGLAAKTIDPVTGDPTTPLVVRDGDGYYQYIQGTSMAAPHVVGVVADIVGRWGTASPDGKAMSPAAVERQLRSTAVDTACPQPATFRYPDPDLTSDFNAKCEGPATRNGFYGDGIVNAFRAVTTAPARR